MFISRLLLPAILLVAALGGCRQSDDSDDSVDEAVESDQSSEDAAARLAFECAEGELFVLAVSDDSNSAELELVEETLTLERLDTDTGARFGSDSLEVWLADSEPAHVEEGGAFIVENGEMTYQDCSVAGGP